MEEHEWKAGQEVYLTTNRGDGAFRAIDAVTAAGRAKIGERLFNKTGHERGGSLWHGWHIQPVTDQLRAEVKAMNDGRVAFAALKGVVEAVRIWALDVGGTSQVNPPRDPVIIEKAKRITAAINAAMECGE